MANRMFNRAQNLEKEVKSLFAEVSIGSSGAPTLTKGLGIASISRSSTGLYVVTLQDKYVRFMHASVQIMSASAEDAVSQLVSEDVDVAQTISFRIIKGSDGLVVDPASGDKLFIKIDLKNSSI